MRSKIILGLFLLASCSQIKESWVNSSDLKNPESAVYSSNYKAIFVSNVNGTPTEKDGNGFISMLNEKGRALASPWVDGLNAPKGMAISNNTLYVTDIDTLVAINIEKSTIINKWVVPDAKFLNDTAAAPNGDIYFSDMMDNKIYVLKNNVVELFSADPALQAPNGVTVKDNKIYIANWGVLKEGFTTTVAGHIISIDLDTKKVQTYINENPIGNLDGLEFFDKGFFVSDWMNGKIFKGDAQGTIKQILDLGQGAADIGLIPESRTLLVPQMMKNELRAYTYK